MCVSVGWGWGVEWDAEGGGGLQSGINVSSCRAGNGELVEPLKSGSVRVQELCESRGGRPGVSVDGKQYCTMLTHWSLLVPNMSTDIRGH